MSRSPAGKLLSWRWIDAPNRAEPVLALIALGLGLVVAGAGFVLVLASATPLPITDQWDELVTGRPLTLGWLFSQHFEHRLVLPRLLFWLDARLFHETNVLNFALVLALPMAFGLLVAWLVRRARPERPALAAIVLGAAMILLYWAAQQENLLWAFEHQHLLLDLAALSSFAVLALGPATSRNLILVILLETASAFTMAGGLPVAALVVAFAIWLRRPRRDVVVLLAAGVVLTAVYFVGYLPVPRESPVAALSHPGDLALFLLAQIGSPFGCALHFMNHRFDRMLSSEIVGAVGLSIWMLQAASWLRHRDTPPVSAVFGLTATWIVGLTFLTALGRIDRGLEYALMSRYCTETLVFWLCLIAVPACGGSSLPPVPAARILAGAGLLVLGLAITWHDLRYVREILRVWRVWEGRISAEPALLAGVLDRGALGHVTFNPVDSLSKRSLLKAGHASVFAERWSEWLGTPLASQVSRIDATRCRGAFDSAQLVDPREIPGWRATGWAWDTAEERAVSRVVLTDDRGLVVGYGRGGFRAGAPLAGVDDGWQGAFAIAQPGAVSAFALSGDLQVACPLGGPLQIVTTGRP